MLSADETRRDVHLYCRHAGCHHMYVSCSVSHHTMHGYGLQVFRGWQEVGPDNSYEYRGWIQEGVGGLQLLFRKEL